MRKLHALFQQTEQEYGTPGAESKGFIDKDKLFYYLKEFDIFVRLLTISCNRQTKNISCNYHKNRRRIPETDVENVDVFAWTFIAYARKKLQIQTQSQLFDQLLQIIEELKLKQTCIEEFYWVGFI